MASPKPVEVKSSGQGLSSLADASASGTSQSKGMKEVMEEWDMVLQVPPAVAGCEDVAESAKTQPCRSSSLQRLHEELEQEKTVAVSKQGNKSWSGKAWSPGPLKQQAAARSGNIIPLFRKFQPSLDVPNFQPEWQEIDDLVRFMRQILRNPGYGDHARLNSEDEEKVRNLLEYHPRAQEKKGPGVDHIQVQWIREDSRGFCVVRTDGTEEDFSFHKCIQAKVAKEFPDLLKHYSSLFQTPWAQVQKSAALAKLNQSP